MRQSAMFAAALSILITLSGCRDVSAPQPEPVRKIDPKPTMVVITDLVIDDLQLGQPALMKITLKNNGGPGTYYIEFRYSPAAPGGAPTFGRTESLNVPTGYTGTQVLDMSEVGDPEVVTVNTRAEHESIFLETDCRVLRGTYVCDQGWD
jgi:hypothetical protein